MPLPEAPVRVPLKGVVRGCPGMLVTIRGTTLADVQAQFDAAAQHRACGGMSHGLWSGRGADGQMEASQLATLAALKPVHDEWLDNEIQWIWRVGTNCVKIQVG